MVVRVHHAYVVVVLLGWGERAAGLLQEASSSSTSSHYYWLLVLTCTLVAATTCYRDYSIHMLAVRSPTIFTSFVGTVTTATGFKPIEKQSP